LGLVAGPFIRARATPEQLTSNVLLSAIPFLLIFVAIILTFIMLIVALASMLNNNIPLRIYRPVEQVLIAGIVLGILGMFQPWAFIAYRIGFFVLLISTLGFIVWSHIVPKGVRRQEDPGPLSVSEFESSEIEGGT
jgi:hypothetical protein